MSPIPVRVNGDLKKAFYQKNWWKFWKTKDTEKVMSELSWICQECGQAHYDRDTKKCVMCHSKRYITKGGDEKI